ncbi:MAG: hypothetical protein ACREX4_23740 [Gammaproteobacteria bacterium]
MRGIDLSVALAEMAFPVGPRGSGKTTARRIRVLDVVERMELGSFDAWDDEAEDALETDAEDRATNPTWRIRGRFLASALGKCLVCVDGVGSNQPKPAVVPSRVIRHVVVPTQLLQSYRALWNRDLVSGYSS